MSFRSIRLISKEENIIIISDIKLEIDTLFIALNIRILEYDI